MRRAGRLIFAVAIALAAAAGLRDAADRWIDATAIPPLVAETSVEVLDREGRLLRAYTVADGLWRLPVRIDAVDPTYLRMLVAFEDRRFRDHPGVDLRALARAGLQALRNGRILSGGSTLTMQTARLLEDGTTGALAGKLRQMRVALALERRLSKDQILELYLNSAPFGGNLEGVRAASFAYFGKEPQRLTPAEAALLVAIPQAPVSRRPDRHTEAARIGRDRVLARAAAAGVISAEDAQAARHEPVPAERRPFPSLAAHLADRLRGEAPLRDVHRTTLSYDLQASLETLAARTAASLGDRISVAIVVAQTATGEILAHVGGADPFSDARSGWVDMTRAVRSPGSTLKPLIYALAFDRGLAHPDTVVVDGPLAIDGYAPANFDGRYRGPVRMAEALRLSLNTPVVALTEALGPASVIAALRRSGAHPQLPEGSEPGLAISLGGIGVSLEDMVGLYAALASGGRRVPLIARLEDPMDARGRDRARGSFVVGRAAAWQVADILDDMPPPRHGARLRLAYKTGTSYGNRDAWVIGFDGAHVVGIWIGRADGTAVPGLSGAGMAAPVLHEVFARLKPDAVPLPPPPGDAMPGPTSALPQHLRRFDRPHADSIVGSIPRVVFPPSGARLDVAEGLLLRVEDGRPPYTWLVDGAPVAVASQRPELVVPRPSPGWRTIAVIDSSGSVDRVTVRLDDGTRPEP